MDLQITTPDDEDGNDLVDLRDWLADVGATRGIRVSLRRADRQPGEMSGAGVVDALVTAFSDETTVVAVSTAVAGWFAARASSRRTRIKVRHGDREIEIDSAGLRDPEQVARRMREELLEDEPPRAL